MIPIGFRFPWWFRVALRFAEVAFILTEGARAVVGMVAFALAQARYLARAIAGEEVDEE